MCNRYKFNSQHTALLAVLLITATFTSNANTNPSSPRIIGGVNSLQGSWPFMSALMYRSILQKNSFCGGSYIGGRWVLTAAHCVKSKKGRTISARKIKVNVGALDLATDRDNTFNVSQIWVHPSFEYSAMTHDIALIKLKKQPDNVSPVTILGSDTLRWANQLYEPAVILGRGQQSKDLPGDKQNTLASLPTALFEAETQLIPASMCNDSFNSLKDVNNLSDAILKTDPIDGSMTCAGSPTGATDTCFGDSGGPLLVQYGDKYHLAGVTSWGLGCGVPGLYSVYTRVPAYLDWIEEITGLNLVTTESDSIGVKSYMFSGIGHDDSGGGALGQWLVVFSGLLYAFRKYRLLLCLCLKTIGKNIKKGVAFS